MMSAFLAFFAIICLACAIFDVLMNGGRGAYWAAFMLILSIACIILAEILR